MNWDNQNKDPWGNNNDATDFDDLVKKFSSILGASNKKQKNSNGGGAGGNNGSSGPQFSAGRILSYAFFFFLINGQTGDLPKYKRNHMEPFWCLYLFLCWRRRGVPHLPRILSFFKYSSYFFNYPFP